MQRTCLARLSLSTLLLATTFMLPGCVITIDDDFDTGNDEQGDGTTQAETGSTSEGSTTEGESTQSDTTTTESTTSEGTGTDTTDTTEGTSTDTTDTTEGTGTDTTTETTGEPDGCASQQADGVGLCELFLGWKWDGMDCVPLSGCTCEGADCANLYAEPAACLDAHAQCGGDVPPCAGIQDANGVGLCDLFLGYKWNGMACEGVSGCSCEGLDCDFLYPELDICELETAGCL